MDEISEWMKEASVTQAAAAEVLHVTRPRVSDVVNHKEMRRIDPHGEPRITSQVARVLARLDERREFLDRHPPADLVVGGR